MLSAIVVFIFLFAGEGLCRQAKREYDPLHDECGIDVSERQPCGRKHDTLGELGCMVRGCCFDDSKDYPKEAPRCFLAHRMLSPQCNVAYEDKDDCGRYDILEGECLKRGCCWKPSPRVNDPYCFKSNPGGMLRLMDFDLEVPKAGRVEVFHNNEWGTICDDQFDDNAARVICRQLGFHDGKAQCCAAYGMGQGTILLDSLSCMGHEESFEDCSHDPWGQNDCSHGEDASVVCYEEGEEIPTTTPYSYHTDYPIYPEYGSGNGGKRRRKNLKRFDDFEWYNGERAIKRNRGQNAFKNGKSFK